MIYSLLFCLLPKIFYDMFFNFLNVFKVLTDRRDQWVRLESKDIKVFHAYFYFHKFIITYFTNILKDLPAWLASLELEDLKV